MNNEIQFFLKKLELDLSAQKNDSKAESMSKYMKFKFEFFGISAPLRKEIQKPFFEKIKTYVNSNIKWDIIFTLWEKNEREFQYIAMDWMKVLPKSSWKENDIEKLEWLITNKSWWDSVDFLASHSVGLFFKLFPSKIENISFEWRKSDNIWLQRTCLIFQLKYKSTTNFEFLKTLIVEFKDIKEFFIQKAIAWSLRTYAEISPKEVISFVEEIELKGLAKRDAIRKIIK
jgi:3-methyladenine DNA glycosylase AlkD